MEKNYRHADLSTVFSYDPKTGVIRWEISPRLNVLAGKVAGCVDRNGYRIIRYLGFGFKAHRIAWMLHYGEWPIDQVDHINMIRDDNRIANLRNADPSQNRLNSRAQSNNSHGSKGVAWDAQKQRWVARIMVQGKRMKIGRYRTREEAARAYASAAEKLAGEFARW
jgi:hypothetical protein